MLPRSKRLNLKKDFKWVASGRKIETKSLRLIFKFGSNPNPLIGIATSSKIFKKATKRNRAKRLASHAIENLYPTLPNYINLVIMPKVGILEKSFDAILKELEDAREDFKFN